MKNLRSHLKAEGKPPIQHQSSSIVSNAALAREINQIVPSPPQQQPFAVAASTSGGLSIDGQSGKAFGSKKRRGDPTNSHASRQQQMQNQWQDGGHVNQPIPEYRVVEDKFAAGYIAGLQRQKRLKQYMNQVYTQGAASGSSQNAAKMQPGHIRPTKRQVGGTSNAPLPKQEQQRTMYGEQKHRFSSSNLDDRSVNTEDQQLINQNVDRQRLQKQAQVGAPMLSVKNSSNTLSQNRLGQGHSQNLNIKQQHTEQPYGANHGLNANNQHTRSNQRISLAKPISNSGRKARGESRSQNRRVVQVDASSTSQTRRDTSLNRRSKAAPAVPIRTREEIEAETNELNSNARDVLANYKQLCSLWDSHSVPTQHRVAFIESVKVLDMKMMAQVFEKEVSDLQVAQAPIVNCMFTINRREECLREIYQLNEALEATPEPQQAAIVDQLEGKLKELRALSIRCVELVVLWRDQFRYIALIGSKQRTIRKRRAQTAIQVPFLIEDGRNYLLKMKTDTIQFANLQIGKHFNFADAHSRGDPFLIQTSVAGNIVAGNRARALRKGKEGQGKRTLPLAEDDMSKAKACEEMILYERNVSNAPTQLVASPINGNASKDLSQGSTAALQEFEGAVLAYIKDTTLPLRMQNQAEAVSQQDAKASQQSIMTSPQMLLPQDSPSPQKSVKPQEQLLQKEETPMLTEPAEVQKPQTQQINRVTSQRNQQDAPAPAQTETANEQAEEVKLILQPLKLHAREFVEFCKDYYQKLVPEIRDSFYPAERLFELMESGYERHYLKIVAYHDGRKMAHGLACVNVDQNFRQGHRAFLRHVSVIRPELFTQALQLIIDFVWRRIHCQHIRMEQFHVPDPTTQKLQADPKLKDILKAQKWKWQSLINDPSTGKRSQFMQLLKPKEGAPEFENPRDLLVGKEPITMKAGMLIQISDNPEEVGISEQTQQLNSLDNQSVQAPLSILSCLKKFHAEAKMNSSSSSAHSLDEYSTLNEQLASMRVKKLLQIADNIRNDQEVDFAATRACLDGDLVAVTKDLESQDIRMALDSQSANGKYLSSVTSLSVRIPAFDYTTHKGKRYLKLKSNQFVFAKSSITEPDTNGSCVVIIPTDDPKLKAVIIPEGCLSQQSQSQSLLEQILGTLTSLQVLPETENTKKQLYLPSFEMKVATRVPELEGVRLSESRRIKEAQVECSVEVIHAKPQDEGLLQERPERAQAEVIDQGFIFVLTDGDLEEKVESMPMFVARVAPENFIAC